MYYCENENGRELSAHVGDRMSSELECMEPRMIQADGHELQAIMDMFGTTIPYPKGPRVVRWYGDFAKSIHYAMCHNTMDGFGVIRG